MGYFSFVPIKQSSTSSIQGSKHCRSNQISHTNYLGYFPSSYLAHSGVSWNDVPSTPTITIVRLKNSHAAIFERYFYCFANATIQFISSINLLSQQTFLQRR